MKKSIISIITLSALITSFNGCGSSTNNSTTKIDLAEYFEKDDRVNNMVNISEHSDNAEPTVSHYTDTVVVKDSLISHEVFGQTTVTVGIQENDLNITDRTNSVNYLVKRYASIGEEISSFSIDRTINHLNLRLTAKCVLAEKRDSVTLETADSDLTYEGDIIVQTCTETGTETYFDLNETFNFIDKSTYYFVKDKGRIGLVNENCWVPHKNTNPDNNETYYDLDDTSKECVKTSTTFDLLLE